MFHISPTILPAVTFRPSPGHIPAPDYISHPPLRSAQLYLADAALKSRMTDNTNNKDITKKPLTRPLCVKLHMHISI